MNREELAEWLKAVIDDLAGELDDPHHDVDLSRALSLTEALHLDSDADVREVAIRLDEAIRDARERRQLEAEKQRRIEKWADLLDAMTGDLPAPTAAALPPQYSELCAGIETKVDELRKRAEKGGLSSDSAIDVAQGLEAELAILRRAAEPRRGERNRGLRERLQAFLATATRRIFGTSR